MRPRTVHAAVGALLAMPYTALRVPVKAGATVPKAECPVCLEQVGVKLDGTFRRHGAGWGTRAWCTGSGTVAPIQLHHIHECQHCPARWDEEVTTS